MAAITAAAVMALREKTGLPMMECKKALAECGGDTEQAVDWLRKQGVKTQALRADRETSMGRLAIFTDLEKGVGTLIELKCESAPVAGSPDFKDFVNDIAKTLALGPGAASPEELLDQKIINQGMLPKMKNAFDALNQGVSKVAIGKPEMISSSIKHTSITL